MDGVYDMTEEAEPAGERACCRGMEIPGADDRT
jgi:hypothetical protein